MKDQNYYNELLKTIPFEAIKNWSRTGLNVSQRKEIFRSERDKGHLNKMKPCYLYKLDGTLIDMFESREDTGEQIEILTGRTATVGYISSCLRRCRPVYKHFWVTEEFPFNKEKYNNLKMRGGMKHVK